MSFSIKSKECAAPTTLKPAAIPLEVSSDEESQQTQNNSQISMNNETVQTTLPPQVPKPDDCNDHTPNEIEMSDSFIRDVILEQQNQDERKQAKRGKMVLL